MLNQCLNPYILLILSVFSIIASIVGDQSTVEVLVLLLLSSVMILIGLREARSHRRFFSSRVFGLFLVLIFISLICDGLSYWIIGSLGLKSLFFVVAALIRFGIFGYGWWSLVKTLATRQKITDRTIVTAIIGYLFIGIICSFIYLTIWRLDPKAFHISALRYYDLKSWNLVMYFSFITLTTVGYGDIIPVNKWLMALANFEAMIGAIYLTVIIARLVSLYNISD